MTYRLSSDFDVDVPDSLFRFDVVISSYALRNLDANEYRTVLQHVVKALKPNGWFVNADIVKSEGKEVGQRIQELRVSGVTVGVAGQDERLCTPETTRAFLDKLEANELDPPRTLDTAPGVIRDAGISNTEVLWKENWEGVIGGPKPVPANGLSGSDNRPYFVRRNAPF